VIDSYELQIDDGNNGDFSEVLGYTTYFTQTTTTIQTGIESGVSYRLRYRVRNVHGWSDFSPISTIMAATIPG
jgi:hypothetical protein